MKKFRFLALFLVVTLAACTQSGSSSRAYPLRDRLKNPLVAERYWAEMVEHLTEFIRQKDPLAEDSATRAIIDAERERSTARVEEVRETIKDGFKGFFIKEKDDVQGAALLLKNVLYFGTDFLAYPNPEQHVYLTTIVDPRDITFPDPTSADLGPLESPYGAQQYVIPMERHDPRFRTAVLYDRRLKVITGIAQLSQ